VTVSVAVRDHMRRRAGDRCEYCHRPQATSPLIALQLEHVIPRKHGGSDDLENLALACAECNLGKGSNLTGIDPQSQQITALFNPRVDTWEDHFRWDGLRLEGRTAIGRTTLRVLDMNSSPRVVVRLARNWQ
jgi:hypothetical protein